MDYARTQAWTHIHSAHNQASICACSFAYDKLNGVLALVLIFPLKTAPRTFLLPFSLAADLFFLFSENCWPVMD